MAPRFVLHTVGSEHQSTRCVFMYVVGRVSGNECHLSFFARYDSICRNLTPLPLRETQIKMQILPKANTRNQTLLLVLPLKDDTDMDCMPTRNVKRVFVETSPLENIDLSAKHECIWALASCCRTHGHGTTAMDLLLHRIVMPHSPVDNTHRFLSGGQRIMEQNDNPAHCMYTGLYISNSNSPPGLLTYCSHE